MRLRWPLTGRSEELRLIESAVSDRDSSGTVIWGAPGVEKSRLAREALSDVLRNIVDHEVADGRLAQHGGSWRWTGEPAIPPGLMELIETRMAGQPCEPTPASPNTVPSLC